VHNGNSWTFHVFAKFLANSERSQIKKDLCRTRHFLDWYYFYHGFAALDWFRDAQRLDDRHMIDNAYLCLNHLTTHRRSYRISLIARLLDRQCTHTGRISFHGNITSVRDELEDPDSRLSSASKKIIGENLHNMITFPWTVDRVTGSGEMSAHLDMHDYALWQKSFMHIVTESIFYEPKLHLTEKIFKPIVSLRPFILVAAPGNLHYLRSYGFKTFSYWIDESYDTEIDASIRLDMIAGEVEKMCARPISDLREMYQDMLPILQHNKKHFFGDFRQLIVSELVDNFEICLRQWNNGRVDGRQRPMLCDFVKVKNLLLNGCHL
jgi:hypothetical protein